jgi:hypothetical protein
MKKISILLLALSVQFSFSNDFDWGKTGHRATGEVAQQHLSRKAKKAISKILDGESLALVSTYADDIKSDRSYKEFSPWHYVNFPSDKKYTDVTPSEHGDVIQGIKKCIAIVTNENSNEEDKAFYLKFLVHLMGDLHQPMHVGHAEDKGGNDIQVQWFGKGSNLHRIWDSNMIDDYGMSYTEIADNLPVLTKTEIKDVQSGELLDWVEESQKLAAEVYGSVEKGEKLSYRYSYKYFSVVEDQLQKGGLRLAKVLNDMFK